jgi:hypothetical protein
VRCRRGFITLRPEQLSTMVYVPPPPLLVVRSHDPQGRWRWWLFTVLAWLATAALAAFAALFVRERIASAGERAEVDGLHRQTSELQQRIAVLERSEQVARAANADLQQVLRDRQEQIWALRADLGFYSRLTGTHARREGLTVQGVHLAAASEPGVYNFTITITQNLKAGELASGRARASVSGVRDGKLTTLAWTDLASHQDGDGLVFSFKYFQQLKSTLMLPHGFTPNRIRVEADAGGEMGRAEQDFPWAEALATAEVTDVQQ